MIVSLTQEQRTRLKEARERKQLSRQQVAAQIDGLTAAQLAMIERHGHVDPMVLYTLTHDIYGCSLEDIFNPPIPMNEHDLHHKTYGEWLTAELGDYLCTDYGQVPVGFDGKVERDVTSIIAHRANDLACHIVSHITEQQIRMVRAGLWSVQQCVDQIPEMVEWPTEREESQS